MKNYLHEKQLTLLNHLKSKYYTSGDPEVPVRVTLRELGELIHVRSAGQVDFHIKALERDGHIERIARSSYIIPTHNREGTISND